MESFEQRMDDAVSNAVGLPSAMIDYYDAIKLAREADAALAAKDAEIARLKAATCEKCQGKGWFADHSSGQYDHDGDGNCLGNCPMQVPCDCVAALALRIERLTALNSAKNELIEFYDTYINDLNGYLHAHNMLPTVEQVQKGERLRARIRRLESE